MSDIKERLEAGCVVYSEEYTDRNGDTCRDIINDEVLTEIQRLEAENKRYREALEEIKEFTLSQAAEIGMPEVDWFRRCCLKMIYIAQQALKGE